MDATYLKGINGAGLKVLDFDTDGELSAILKKQGAEVATIAGDIEYDVIIASDNIAMLTGKLKRFGKLIYDGEITDFIKANYAPVREGQYVKTDLNVMMIYNYNAGTTGDFIERAFRHYARVIRPNVPPNGEGIKTLVKQHKINLVLQVDSGGWTRMQKNVGCPTACYSIDTFNKPEKALEFIKGYDFKFFAQKRFAKLKNEYWLPLAVDTKTYKPVNTLMSHDISFCGTFLVRESQAARNRCIKTLVNEQYKGCINFYLGRDYNDAACLRYNQSRMVFNMGICNDINMRLFEAMGSGVPCLYNDVDGLSDLGFIAGEHYIKFTDETDILKSVYHGINNPKELGAISEKAYVEVLNKHTYKHRVEQIIKTVFDK